MTDEFLTRADFERAAQYIAARTTHRPTIGLVLGSGLNALADGLERADVIPYRDIPGFPAVTVAGHTGALVIGEWMGKTVLVMRGRAHYYEGYSMQRITLPIRAMRLLGVNTLIVTNAAGGLNETFRAGDVMLITDHINFVGMAGANPLRGPNDETLGPRFPDMSQAYDSALCELARAVARQKGMTLREGVYVMLAGPSYESPADVRMLRLLGADAVGMSTVPEVIVARHGGMRVLGLSLISNVLAAHTGVDHAEVLAAGRAAIPTFTVLIQDIIAQMD
jgi:purine-nucleoside phosphorylase